MMYNVYISRVYFPHAIWPKGRVADDTFEWTRVRAASREEAAAKVWAKNGVRWLKLMARPDMSVSLHVGRAQRAWGHEVNRLAPVKVLQTLRPWTLRGEQRRKA